MCSKYKLHTRVWRLSIKIKVKYLHNFILIKCWNNSIFGYIGYKSILLKLILSDTFCFFLTWLLQNKIAYAACIVFVLASTVKNEER